MLPDRFSTTTLEKNLATLVQIDETLCQRICLPVDGTHIHFSQNGEVHYTKSFSHLPFTIGTHDLPGSIGHIGDTSDVLLFGIGLGEQLDYLLEHYSKTKIIAWERDPWLVRLVLMQRDYSTYLRSGHLKLSMSIDILDMPAVANNAVIVCHPFFRFIYENEYSLIKEGVGEKRAIICSGNLFVDDITKALKKLGFSLYTLDIEKLAIEEISGVVKRFNPQFIFSINYTNGLAELCHELDVTLICWEVDPASDRLLPCKTPTDNTYIFTYRKANIEEFARTGFTHISHLPFASDPKKRSSPHMTAVDKILYDAPLSFVGSSMIRQAHSFREVFLSHYVTFHEGDHHAVEKGNQLLEKVLAEQRKDFSVYVLPEVLYYYFKEFISYFKNLPGACDPLMLVGEIAAAEKRIDYITKLGHLGIKVWGDEGWKFLEKYEIPYRGSAGHTHEINKIYAASTINIDINRLYQSDIVNMRVFDILACGGFVIAEYSPDLEELFEIGKEVETFHTFNELVDKATYYLNEKDKALQIATQGQKKVVEKYTISTRINYILETISNRHM